MKLLLFSLKDIKHPQAAGPEMVKHELAKRLVQHGHRVTMIVSSWKNARSQEKIDGYTVIRLGSRFSVYRKAKKYYLTHLKGKYNLVIDELNPYPFMASRFVKEKNIIVVHQLIREIWFYKLYFPFSFIGYLYEKYYLGLLKHKKVITVSESTKQDLIAHGFKAENISIISEGIDIEPAPFLNENQKFKVPTMLSLGNIVPMKRTDHILKAFCIAKETIKDLRLVIAGEASLHYGEMIKDEIELSHHKDSIVYLGKVDNEEKAEIMKKCHVLCVTSVKEGWGLTVTEANSQGTPAVVYNVDGLRDSVRHKRTGLVCKENTPQNLATMVIELFEDRDIYTRICRDAWRWSKDINFDKSYKDFIKALLTM